MKKNCKVEYKVVPNNSLETTRNFLIANKVINSFNAILDLNNFRLAVSELTENARKLGYFPNRIIKEEQNGRKAVFDIPSFKKIDGIKAQQEKIANRQPTLFQLPENQVNYVLKSANALQSDKVRNPKNNLQGFYNDLQKQGVPNQQIDLIKSLNPEGKTKEELLTELLANYSYTVEINTAKDKSPIQKGGYWDRNENYIEGYDELVKDFDGRSIDDESRNFWFTDNFNHHFTRDGEKYFKNGKEIRKSLWLAEKKSIDKHLKAEIDYLQNPTPSQIYSNLTVPGGTAYTENEISTPLITPSIKGHAQFSTDNGLMWSRTDERVQYQENETDKLLKIMENSGILEIKCS